MANKKKAIAGAVASVVALTAVVVPWTTRGDNATSSYYHDITVESTSNLPEVIPADETWAYSFVELLSDANDDPVNNPFGSEHGATLGFDNEFAYDIPWITTNFPTGADKKLPVEYVYYEATIGDGDEAVPMYCIDLNAKSPSFFNDDGYGSYELLLHKSAFNKYPSGPMDIDNYKNSTLMLAPLLYGYPAFSDNYIDLTSGEARWATSAAFKFISGAVYNRDYTYRQCGLRYEDFYDSTMLPGITKQLQHIDSETEVISDSVWRSSYLNYINHTITSSVGFGDDSGDFGLVYNPSIAGYEPDTEHAGQVMGAIYSMLAGAADIKDDNGNFERRMYFEETSDSATVNGMTRRGYFSITLTQGDKYASYNDSYFTDLLLKDDILIDIVGNPSEVYIGDADGNPYPKVGNSYKVPTDDLFYIFTTETEDVTYNFTAVAETVKTFENAFYQSEGDELTQRMLMYVPMDLKGEFSVSFVKENGTLRILKVDASDNTPISDVVFDVYTDKSCTGTPVTRITTVNDGTASCDIGYGTYYLKEVASPEHYLHITEPIEIVVSAEAEAAGTVKTITNTPLGSLKVTKKDSATNNVLAGAKFTLTSANSVIYNGTAVTAGSAIGGEKTTDSNGVIFWDNLPYGTYSLTETQAPSGYLLSDAPISVTISGQDTDARFVEMDVENAPLGSIIITKKDSSTGNPLQGAKFTLTSTSSITYNGVTVAAGSAIDGEQTSGTNGIVSWVNLPLGTYLLTETSAPDGYVFSPTPISITISGTNNETRHIKRDVTNTPLGSLTITKIDAATGDTLQGAKFKLTSAKSITYNDTTVLAGSAIGGEKAVNSNGEISWTNLPYGTYTLVETQAPDGYLLSSTPISVRISGDSNETRYVRKNIPNAPLGSLKVVKEDSVTGDAVNGAVFDIVATANVTYNSRSYSNGDTIATLTTADDGYAIITGLEPGQYLVKETKAPYGYVINETPVTVTVGSNDTSIPTAVIKNSPYGSLKIIKYDADSKQRLSGAEFSLESNVSGEGFEASSSNVLVTDENGEAYIDFLAYGEYILKEAVPPTGYEKTEREYPVIISDENGQASLNIVLEIPNTAQTGRFRISKTNPSKDKPVNASFELFTTKDTYYNGNLILALNPILSFSTDNMGYYESPEIPVGIYKLRETRTESGYILPEGFIETIEITADTPIEKLIELVNYPKDSYSAFKIYKKDEDTKVSLEGAVFEIRDEDGNLVDTITTDDTGVAQSGGLEFGTYFIKEIIAPNGYALSDEVYEVTITGDETEDITLTVYDKKESGQIKIIKIDAFDNSKRIENVSFDIYDEDDNFIGNVNTNHDGEAISSVLPYGAYYIKEVSTPSCYVINNEKIKVILNSTTIDDLEIKTVIVENTPIRGQIKIIKYDENYPDNKLVGAVFDILNIDGKVLETVTTDASGEAVSSLLPHGEYVLIEKKAPEGYSLNGAPINVHLSGDGTQEIVLETVSIANQKTIDLKGRIQIAKRDAITKRAMAKVEFGLYAKENIVENGKTIYKKNQLIQTLVTDKQGVATSNLLPYGSYYVVESKIVDGYVENTKAYNFIINSTNYDVIQSKTIYNTPTEVVITKRDVTTSKPLPGATIEIYDEDKELVYKDVTDQNGEITAFYLPAGKYTFVETDAPDGYVVNHNVFKFEIFEDGTIKGDDTVTDQPTEVIITKRDLTTGAPLAGATITIKDVHGNTVFEEVSGPNGEVKAMHLKPGVYTFTETAAPDGYTRNPETFTFELYPDGTVRGDCTITDRPTEVIITKKDLTTGAPLAGATITIRDSNGNIVFEEVSGPNGEVKVMHLKPGVYTFTETAAPDGYTRNPETFTFELFEDGTVTGDCTITDRPTEVVITKKDLTDASPLPGATIQIIDSNGKLAFEGVTGDDGTVTAFKLVPGVYTFKEISAPDGYRLNTEKFKFELFEDGTVVGDHEIFDERISTIQTGVETEDDNSLPILPIVIASILVIGLAGGAVFKIVKKNSKKK